MTEEAYLEVKSPQQWQRLLSFDTSITLTDSAYLSVREKWSEHPVSPSLHPYEDTRSLSEVHQLHITDKAIEMGGGRAASRKRFEEILQTTSQKCKSILMTNSLEKK